MENEMGRIEELRNEILSKKREINELQEEVITLLKEQYSGMVGKCYRDTKSSVFMITKIDSVTEEYIFVFLQSIRTKPNSQGKELEFVSVFTKFEENRYEEITKEDFCNFIITMGN